jgi:hypothetical protein
MDKDVAFLVFETDGWTQVLSKKNMRELKKMHAESKRLRESSANKQNKIANMPFKEAMGLQRDMEDFQKKKKLPEIRHFMS